MKNKRKYKISTCMNDGMLEIVLTGEVPPKGFNKIVKKVYSIIAANNPEKLLVDVRLIKGRYGYTKAYFQIRDYPSSFHNIKHALVDIPDYKDYRTFYEYIAVRVVGLSFKWFTDLDIAKIWLQKQ